MSTPPQHRIRMLLQKYHDGLTLLDISNYLNMNYTNTGRSLEKMPDAYIDRWTSKVGKGRGKWSAVWCVVVPPENCPMPFGAYDDRA
jgi:hypothetical protein